MEKGTTISHYEILEKLGQGGMGVVYKARDTRLSRDVALKFLSPHLTADNHAKTRFLREARAASSLDHPNISVIHEIGDTEDGRSFISMSYYNGETLKKRLERGPIDIGKAVQIALKIANGLQYAHEKGIVHRDIKPENIMLTDRGDVKIVDFGLAKLVRDSGFTATGNRGGTLAYMSPEQLKGEAADHRTDLYSLGILLYEMLTGKHPHKEEHEAALMYSIVNVDPAPPSIINSAVPGELEEIVLKLIKKNPNNRFSSAEDVVAQLKEYLDKSGSVLDKKLTGLKNRFIGKKTFATVLIAVLVITALALPDSRSSVLQLFNATTTPDDIHLVVLPFNNVGDDPANKAFNVGLMETLTSSLTLLQPRDVSYWVVSASEVRHRNITSASDALKEFNATLAVYGSVQRLADQIRLTLNVVDTETLRQIKSELISVPTDSLQRLQDEAVLTLAGMLNIERETRTELPLTAGGTIVSESYEFYLEGRGYLQDYQDPENIERAISLFERAIELDPQYTLAYAGLGEAYWRMYDETRDAKWVDRAIEYAERAKNLNNSLPAVHVTLGMIQRGTGRYDEAVISYKKALELDAEHADAYRGLALAYDQLGNTEDAEKTYKQAIRLQPSYWAGYNQLGGYYMNQGRIREAIEQYKKVTELIPDSNYGFFNLGVAYYYLDDFQKAIDMFNKTVEIEPDYDVYSNLATLYYYHESNYEKAAEMYDNALELRDHDYRVWGFYASALRWSGADTKKVEQIYNKALRMAEEEKSINPRDAQLLTHIAGYHAALGNDAEAREHLLEALEIAPDNIEVMDSAGRIFEQLGERDRALSLITRAVERGYPLLEIENDPGLRELRSDTAYIQFMKEFTDNEKTRE